jgi:hypothetical protein
MGQATDGEEMRKVYKMFRWWVRWLVPYPIIVMLAKQMNPDHADVYFWPAVGEADIFEFVEIEKDVYIAIKTVYADERRR